MAVYKMGGHPVTTHRRADFPVIAANAIDMDTDETETRITVRVETVPENAVWLVVQIGDGPGGVADAAVGTITVVTLEPLVEDQTISVCAFWVSVGGYVGPRSEWVNLTQSGTIEPEPPEEVVTVIAVPVIYLDGSPQVGTNMHGTPAEFSGEPSTVSTFFEVSDSASPLDRVWMFNDAGELSADGTAGYNEDGAEPLIVDPGLYGYRGNNIVAVDATITRSTHPVSGASIPVEMAGKYIRLVSVADGSVIGVSDFINIEALAADPALDAGDWSVDSVEPLTGDTEPYVVTLSINIDVCDPSDYGSGLRVQWNTSRPEYPVLFEETWELLTPVGVSEGLADVVSGTTGQWYLNREIDRAETGVWDEAWLFKPEARNADVGRASRLTLRYSTDDGATWTNASDVKAFDLPDGPVDPPVDPPTNPVDAYWRSPETTARMGVVAPTRYGRGYQYMRGLSTGVSHNVIMAFGDMCWVRRSENFGASWDNIKGSGLEQWAFDSGAIDPHDPDYAMAFGYSGWFDGTARWEDARGIWRTTDGGDSWTHVKFLEIEGTTQHRYFQQLFAYDPATDGLSASQRNWYFLYQNYVDKNHPDNGAYILKSTNGGASWTQLGGKIADSKFGQIYQLQMHPTQTGRLYACTKTGLWTTTNPGGGAGTWSRVSGVPATKCRSLDIHQAGQKMYASIQSAASGSNGVWYSGNSGGGWSRVYNAQPVKTLMVDWKTSPATVYVKTTQSQPNDLIIGKGGNWTNNVPRTGMLGYESDSYHKKLSISGNGYGMLVDKTQAGRAIIHAVGRMFMTENAGGSFADSTWGLTGINTSMRGRMTPDPNRPQDTIFGAEDIGFCRMADYGGGGIETSRVPDSLAKAMLGAQRAISSTGAIATRGGREIQIVGAGPHSVAYREPGSSTWKAGAGADPSALGVLAEHPTADGVLIAGKWRSLNDGVNWSGAGKNAVAMSIGGALYSSGNSGKDVHRATNWTSGSATWVPFYQSTKHIKALGSSVNLVLEPGPV